MPYIIMHSTMNQTDGHIDDAALKRSITFIEYHVDKLKERADYENMEEMMRQLVAERYPLADDSSPYCTYEISCLTFIYFFYFYNLTAS